MKRPIAGLFVVLFYFSAGVTLTLPFTAVGCGSSSGETHTVAPGTDHRGKEQREMDDFMQNANKPKPRTKAKTAH